MNPFLMRFVKRVVDTFVDLNCPVEGEFVDPDTMNLKSELYIELLKNLHLWIDVEGPLMERLCVYVENSQNFDANAEFIRPLMSHEDMAVCSLRIITYCLAALCKSWLHDPISDDMDSDDGNEPPLETDYPYVEGEDFINILKYQNRDDDEE